MQSSAETALEELNQLYIAQDPRSASSFLEFTDAEFAAETVAKLPEHLLRELWLFASTSSKLSILSLLSDQKAALLLSQLDTIAAAALLSLLTVEKQDYYLSKLNKPYANAIREQMSYPQDTAGYRMEQVKHVFDRNTSVRDALRKIKKSKLSPSLSLYLTDDEMNLCGRTSIQSLLLADDEQSLMSLAVAEFPFVSALAPVDEVITEFEAHKIDSLPVVDAHNHIIGILHASNLIEAIKEDATANMQTMVGASADEKALSSSLFSVRKRLPWLFINLLTAFLAASVVGLFEGLIAKYTALAVLLPVVAGQSGNAGAQALAITMRGLSLREITVAHWLRLVVKEMSAGFFSGVAIAIVCAIAVYFWSQSLGVAFVLALSMVLSVSIACVSGALVPIVLKVMKQDPAQSSSIILTTITDVTGFFSFLGIATLLSKFL